MKKCFIFSILVVALLLEHSEAFPRIQRQYGSEEDAEEAAGIQRRQTQIKDDELSPEELKEDVDKIMTAVHKQEEKVGHALEASELEKLGEKMMRLPWYRRFGKWVAHHWRHLKATLKESASLLEPILLVAKTAAIAAVTAGAGK